jgi:demethylmenaquinone methyltransferase/2-methoxy-6-polyprenyl-1,4-benzoquinol methylase
MFSQAEIQNIYRRRARHYNLSANLYYLLGFREHAYRKMAVTELRLKPGDTVVELGCGTGLNFPLLREAVGSEGRIIGVDLTDAMLEQARRQVERKGWSNVELVKCDASRFDLPENTHAVLSTFAYTLIPQHASLTRKIATELPSGSRMVVLDLKKAEKWPVWLFRFALWVTAPFAVTEEYAGQYPWQEMHKRLKKFTIRELFFGGAYIASGDVP